jgi:SNF2 family DNA or RNA helicase
LSGTPIQNDLEEFYSMCNFVNPGILGNVTMNRFNGVGTLKSFKTNFVNPIMKGREENASNQEKLESRERSTHVSYL